MRDVIFKMFQPKICITLSVFNCFVIFLPGQVIAATLKVMTFNIKTAPIEIGFDQHTSWDYIFGNSNDRRDRVVSVINDAAPDIVGVQEMRGGQLDYMDDRLSNYFYYGLSRNTGTAGDSGERSGIFYNKDRFRRLGQGEFWLSETPDVPGTTFYGNGEDTNSPRNATWIKLLDYETDLSYFIINTHWALDSEARLQSGLLMREKILELSSGMPILAMGDFNERTTGNGYRALVRSRAPGEFELNNSYFESGAPSGKTFHGYNGGVDGSPIDFVLHSKGDFVATSAAIVRTAFDGYYPSDHYPVEAVLDVVLPVPGDFDGNGSVGSEDYARWRATFGSTSQLDADGNSDGKVDAADYVYWRARMGADGGASATHLVPEPLRGEVAVIFLLAACWLRLSPVRQRLRSE